MKPLKPEAVYSTEAGPYELVWAGKGARAGGSLQLTLKLDGRPYGGWLYLSGRDDPAGPAPHYPDGDAEVRVEITNGNGGKSVVVTVPVVHQADADFVSRLDVGRYLSRGTNTIAVSGYDLNSPEGAFAYAVYRGGAGTPQRLVQVADGADLAHFAAAAPYGPDTELASFRFTPSGLRRVGRVILAVGGADAGGGDEVFAFTGTGGISGGLSDTDRDGLPDIVNRRVPLTEVDEPPLSMDAADKSGKLEARRVANCLEEDALGVPRAEGGLGVGVSVLDAEYDLPEGRTHANFQVQSEDPEDGDSLKLFAAINVIVMEGVNPVPDVEVVKDASPAELPEGGGTATFTVTVNNIGGESLQLTSLTDDVFGDLNGAGTCAVPVLVAIGASYGCTFTADLTGSHETPHRDVVTAVAAGVVSGLPVSASDDAVVGFAPHRGSRVGGRAWADRSRDGVQDPEEGGLNGVSVLLRDATGAIVGAATTGTIDGFAGSYVIGGLEAGVYTVEMIPPANWSQTYDPDGLATPNRSVRSVGVDEGGMDIAFGYAPDPGRIVVTKVTDPAVTAQRFDFATSWGAHFALGSGEIFVSAPLPEGVYGVSEGLAAGWNQISATCDDGSPPEAISLQPGETVTCTFVDAMALPGLAKE